MEQIQFPAVAVVKAGPHKSPWLQSPTSMDTDLPEGQLVVAFKTVFSSSGTVQVACDRHSLHAEGGWCVHIDSLEIIDSWEK